MNKNKRRSRGKTLLCKVSAAILAGLLTIAVPLPAFAADTTAKAAADIQVNGETIGTIEGYDQNGDGKISVGPGKELNVRSTYYDTETGKDYDLVSGDLSGEIVPGTTLTYAYQEHTEENLLAVVNYYVKQKGVKTILQTKTETVEPGSSITFEQPETLTIGDVDYSLADISEKTIEVKYDSNDSLQYDVAYVQASDETDPYTVTVKYVTKDGSVLDTRTMHVNGKDVVFYAPTMYGRTADGTTTWYKLSGSNIINHKVGSDVREYTLVYGECSESVWTIYRIDISTGKTIDSVTKEVPAGSTGTYTPEVKLTGYTLSSAYTDESGAAKEITLSYQNMYPLIYLYYVPDGYVVPEETEKEITVNYIDIANTGAGAVRSEKVMAAVNKDTYISLADSFSANGKTYQIIAGQGMTADDGSLQIRHSYYSAKVQYNIYYRDINNTRFTGITIITELIIETQVIDGTTNPSVNPRIARIAPADEASGSAAVISREDATGETVTDEVDAETEDEAEAVEENDIDTTADTAEIDDADIPLDDMELNTGDESDSETAAYEILTFISIAATAAAIAVVAALLIKIKRKVKDQK